MPTSAYRKAYQLNALHKAIAEELLAGTLGACLGLGLVVWLPRPGGMTAGADR